jgi:predicted enzyme related to lactoylglutathione lyase
MLNKLRTVVYHVADLQAAKLWYAKAIGIEPYFDEPFYVGFILNGFELGLDPDMNSVEQGNHHCAYWDVAEMEKTIEHFVALGATVVEPAHGVGGSIQVAIVQDPFGNHIGLISGE